MMAAFGLLRIVPPSVWALAAFLAIGSVWLWQATNAAYERGRAYERQSAIIAAGKRIVEMEKANEDFRNLPARERCLAFMRDSGLPANHCD